MRRVRQWAVVHPRTSLLVAPAVFLIVWSVALLSGLRLDFARDRMMQFVGAEELASVSYAEAWRSIHMQPPGFNMILKYTDSVGAGAEVVWLALLLAATLVALWMVGDLVWTLTGDLRWSLASGLLAAVIPGTLYYSLWVFYTQLAAVLLTTMVWGLAVGLVRRSGWALTIAAVSALPLFLLRSTYVWILVIIWILVVLALGWRQLGSSGRAARLSLLVTSVGGVLVVIGVQALSWTTFGSITQSSWGYENAAKAVMTQLSVESRVAAAHGDPCLEQVLAVGVFEPIGAYPECARGAETRDHLPTNALLEENTWQNGYPNLNTTDRLALAEQWREFSVNAVADNPWAVLRIPFPNFETQERGTIARFLWPSSWYWLIESNVAAGGLLATVWIVAFSWVPAAGLLGILLGLFTARRRWNRGDARRFAYVVGSILVLGISVAYLFLETGENERFRVEIDWLIIALGAVGWMLWIRRRRSVPVDQLGDERRTAARR